MQDVIFFIKQNLLVCGAWLAVLTLLLIIELRERIFGPKSLSSSQLIMELNQNNAVLLDLRASADYSKGHITQAENFNITNINDTAVLLKRIESKLDNKQRPLILVCKDGLKSKSEAFKLKSNGLTNVSYLYGGMTTWETDGLPTVTN